MTSTERRKLKNHVDRSGGTPAHGWFPLAFGLVFAALGLFVFGLGMGWIPVDPDNVHGPRWVISCVGGMFGLPGLWLFGHGAWSVYRTRRRNRIAQRHPDRPWLADHDWDPSGAWDGTPRRIGRSVVMATVFVVFLAPFHWWAFGSGEGPWLVKLIVVVFDLVILLLVWMAIEAILHRLRYGRSRLRFSRFPFLLGEELGAWLHAPRGMAGASRLEIALRCVEEAYEQGGESTQIACYEVYRDERTLDLAGQGLSRGPLTLPLHFDLPDEGEPSDLSRRPPRYWEVEVTAEAPGVDHHSVFLVPVYRSP